ncbi:MAG: 50S ribosomal protein L31 [Parcubacteria group bacterium GW2011_GWA2_38_27]|nr:MAG: 50S ribosomal protein L31 [Parcubacteria group bacterium GW2011_GWA2_38_27]
MSFEFIIIYFSSIVCYYKNKLQIKHNKFMKDNIHPKYHEKAKVVCACGNCFEVGSTNEHIDTEICYNCHPFYTGKEKIVDTLGRVDKFKKKMAKKETFAKKKKK